MFPDMFGTGDFLSSCRASLQLEIFNAEHVFTHGVVEVSPTKNVQRSRLEEANLEAATRRLATKGRKIIKTFVEIAKNNRNERGFCKDRAIFHQARGSSATRVAF